MPLDPNDQDIVVRTIVGEASNQRPEGQQAVANVILNRLNSGKYGGSARDVVLAPYQFEPWQTRRGELEAIRPESPAYQSALAALQAAQSADVTNGATHFLEPNIVRQRRGGTLPGWAQGPSTQIGDHLFFKPEGGGPGRVATGTPQQVTQAAPQNAAPMAVAPVAATPATMGETFAALAPEPESSNNSGLIPSYQSRKPPPFGSAGEEVDTSAFEPRTTRNARPRARRA